jgi:hypothetical protein
MIYIYIEKNKYRITIVPETDICVSKEQINRRTLLAGIIENQTYKLINFD